MVMESELREEMAKVVAQEASLEHLYRWLMARNWNVLRDSDSAAVDLAVDVEELLVEWSNQDRSREDVLLALSLRLRNLDMSALVVEDEHHAPFIHYSASANSLPVQFAAQLA